jgi:hypothetical protein
VKNDEENVNGCVKYVQVQFDLNGAFTCQIGLCVFLDYETNMIPKKEGNV